MKVSIETIMKKLSIILLFYGFFSTLLVSFFRVSFIDNLDEILTVVLLVCLCIKKTSHGSFRFNKGVFYLVGIAIFGLCGSFSSGINTKYCLLGMFLVLKSFLLYFVFEEIKWNIKDVHYLVNALKKIYFVFISLGIVFYFVPAIAPFKTFGMSSICNHPAIFATLLVPFVIYCVIAIVEEGKINLVIPLLVAVVCVILANTSKNIVSIGAVIVIYMFVSRQKRKYIFFALAGFAVVMLASQIVGVLSGDIELYFNSVTAASRPRIVLLNTGVEIAKDYFPLGSGFGTYGGSVARNHYSEIYNMYGINGRNGLSATNGKYLTDTYWPSIIGETGFVGTFLLILFLIKIVRNSINNFRYCREVKVLSYVALLSFIALIFESLFTSTFFGLRCYLGIGMLGIYNSIMNSRKESLK